MDKKELRKHFSEVRKSANSKEKSHMIAKKALFFEKLRFADIVLMYASYKTEVDTHLMAIQLSTWHKKIAFPKCNEDGTMDFYIVDVNKGELEKGRFGIPEPVAGAEKITEFTEKTVCIVPALAFTEQGYRLGYGGGFYDRFLSEYPDIYTIGLAFESCIAENLPTEEHDIKVKSVITEERTIICNE